jgi:DNA-binding CsgD family transcriptional regulator
MPVAGTSLARGGRLVELCRSRLDSVALRQRLRGELERVVPFDLYCVNTVDPRSLLITSSIGDGLSPEAARRWFELEEAGRDYNRLTELAQGRVSVATLARVTRGDVRQSPRMRELFWPQGLRDELRAALCCDGACWGYLHLFRREPFRAEEVRSVELLLPLLARALRASQLLGQDPVSSRPPAVLLLGERQATPDAHAGEWLHELEADVGEAMPHALIACRARVRSGAAASGVYRAPRGNFVLFNASRLGAGVALSLSVPSARELAPFWCLAHGLTPRELQICALLLDGHSNEAIATLLGIRLFTVKDHVKSILSKTRAPSRVALLAALCV